MIIRQYCAWQYVYKYIFLNTVSSWILDILYALESNELFLINNLMWCYNYFSCTHWKRNRNRKKKTIPFRENLFGSIRPIPGLHQFFMLDAVTESVQWEAPKNNSISPGVTSKRIEPAMVQLCFWSSAGCVSLAQGELISGSAVSTHDN